MAIDMFTTRTMLSIVQKAEFKPTTYLRDRFFKNVRTFSTEVVDIDIVDNMGRKIAPFVNPKIGGMAVARDGYRTNTYKVPEVSPMRVTDAEDMLKRMAGESIYGSKSPTERAAEQLGRDLRYLDEIITRREEVMCAEALFSGKVTVKGEGYDEEVVYWQGGDEPFTALEDKWSDVEVEKIMADLRMFRRKMIQKGGVAPTDMIVGNGVIEVLLDKLSKAQQLDMRRVDLGHVDPQHLPNGVSYWGYLKDSAIDIYTYDSWYEDPSDGEEKPFVPDNKVLLASPNVATTMAYGCVALAGDDEVAFYAEPRVPDSWVQRANPSGRVVQIKSRPLPIVHQPHGFHVIDAI